jgi:demethylmenaquinone methyltransferase/2-methoxy-6-polyprenyl-1,4-benzoquinol methylase
MFDRIAPRYDLLNRLLSAGIDRSWRRAAVDSLEPTEGARVLDLCTGTADLLLEALRDPRRVGFGIDLSFEMLRRGAAKAAARGLAARAGLAAGDAEQLPLRAECVDAALVAFGIRNVARPAVALAELRRVLRAGGRLVVLEFAMPPGFLGRLYRVYFEHVLPRLGALVSRDAGAYRYLPASVARFPSPAHFGQLLVEAGFRDVRWRSLSLGVAYLYQAERAA